MDAVKPLERGIQIGVDIGQRVDPTAIVVARLELRDYKLQAPAGVDPRMTIERNPVGGDIHFTIPYLARLPLGTPYPDVAERLAEVYRNAEDYGTINGCWVDATGVGKPVVDVITAKGIKVTAVTLTGGEKATKTGGELRLAKQLMVSRLQVLLQRGLIHMPDTYEARALQDELLNYEIKVTDANNLQFAARTGKHDDLATALGLACWEYKAPPKKAQSYDGGTFRSRWA